MANFRFQLYLSGYKPVSTKLLLQKVSLIQVVMSDHKRAPLPLWPNKHLFNTAPAGKTERDLP